MGKKSNAQALDKEKIENKGGERAIKGTAQENCFLLKDEMNFQIDSVLWMCGRVGENRTETRRVTQFWYTGLEGDPPEKQHSGNRA